MIISVSDESKRSCWHDPIPDQALLQVDLQEEGIDYEQVSKTELRPSLIKWMY